MLRTDGKEFKQVVKGKNPLTPEIMAYYTSGDYLVELSRGEGFGEGDVYGVTVVDSKTMQHNHNKSDMFYSRTGAVNYIKEIGNA
jgi:hypothetical protein